MNGNPAKKQVIISLLIVFFITLTIFLGVSSVGQKHEIRKKAAGGTGVVKLTISPRTLRPTQGESFPVEVKMTSTQAKQIRVAGVDLEFNPNVFSISSIACSPSLPTAARAETINNKIYLSCFKPGGSLPLSLTAGQQVVLGSFQATVKSTSPLGATNISFTRTLVPDATTAENLADDGTTASFFIVIPCPSWELGNISCDVQGLRDETDLSILLHDWSPNGPAPIPEPTRRSADIDSNNKVDETDLNILLRNWRT